MKTKFFSVTLFLLVVGMFLISHSVRAEDPEPVTIGYCPETTEAASVMFAELGGEPIPVELLQRIPSEGCGWVVLPGSEVVTVYVPRYFWMDVANDAYDCNGPCTYTLPVDEQASLWLTGLPYPTTFFITASEFYAAEEGTLQIAGDSIPDVITSAEWDFGDGNTFTSNDPSAPVSYTYSQPWAYTLTVHLINEFGEVVYTIIDYLDVLVLEWTTNGYCPETTEAASVMFAELGGEPIPVERLQRIAGGGCGWVVLPGEEIVTVYSPRYFFMDTANDADDCNGPCTYEMPTGEQVTLWLTGLPYPTTFFINASELYAGEEGTLWITGDIIPDVITSAEWYFGDGNTFTSNDPSAPVMHTYSIADLYDLVVFMKNEYNELIYVVVEEVIVAEPLAENQMIYLPLVWCSYVYVDPWLPYTDPVMGFCPGEPGYPTIWELVGGTENDWEKIDEPGCGFRYINWDSQSLAVTIQEGMIAYTLRGSEIISIAGPDKVYTDLQPFSIWVIQWWPNSLE